MSDSAAAGDPVITSAPGKVLLAGEYAVLSGHAAVVAAVTRRVSARLADTPPQQSPFLAAVSRLVAEHFGAGSAPAERARRVVADSTALRDSRGVKYGLGSSAAATVAATAAALAGHAGYCELEFDRALVHRIAHRAHGDAQAERGARGSGVDIAASVFGGVIVATPPVPAPDDPHPVAAVSRIALPSQLSLVFVATGLAADTATLVAAVDDFAAADPGAHAGAIDVIASAADELRTALESDSADKAVAAIEAGRAAIAALGTAAGLDLETDVHRRIDALARARGGAAKPTGAGAGDAAVAAFTSVADSRRFRDDLADAGIEPIACAIVPHSDAAGPTAAPVPLAIDPSGVTAKS